MNKKALWTAAIAGAILFACEAVAQSSSAWSSEAIQQLRQISETALHDDYAYRQAAHLTDNIGPRMAGSSQATAAVEYVADEMRKLGLEVEHNSDDGDLSS